MTTKEKIRQYLREMASRGGKASASALTAKQRTPRLARQAWRVAVVAQRKEENDER